MELRTADWRSDGLVYWGEAAFGEGPIVVIDGAAVVIVVVMIFCAVVWKARKDKQRSRKERSGISSNECSNQSIRMSSHGSTWH